MSRFQLGETVSVIGGPFHGMWGTVSGQGVENEYIVHLGEVWGRTWLKAEVLVR